MLVSHTSSALAGLPEPPSEYTVGAEARWKSAAAAKVAALQSSIPLHWKIPAFTLSSLSSDVRPVVLACGILSELDVEITEIDDVQVLLDRIASRQYFAIDVAQAFCARASIAHQLTNCLTETMFDTAFRRAAELDEYLALNGCVMGPLHGLPVSLKDQFDVEGVDSTMGFVSRVGHPATRSSVLVRILENLGAIVFCKTNVPQSMMAAETNNNVFGRTLNPRNRELTVGGSSGGEGALLALKGSIIGVGTDFGGSVRVPCLCGGLYGLRPTTRRLPYEGVSNVLKGFEGIESTVGPLARSINSIEVFMRAVLDAKPWLADYKVIELPWNPCISSSKLHVAVSFDNERVHSHPPVKRALRETVEALRWAGHEVTELGHLDHREAGSLVAAIAGADGGADLRTFLAGSHEPVIPEAFPFGQSGCTVYELSQLIVKRDAFRQGFLELWTNSANRSVANRPFDLVLCPITTHLAWPHLGRPQNSQLITWTTIWSLLDLPAITLPVGEIDPVLDASTPLLEASYSEYDQEHWDAYSPQKYANAALVVQLVSPRRYHEEELLGLASVVEKTVKEFKKLVE